MINSFKNDKSLIGFWPTPFILMGILHLKCYNFIDLFLEWQNLFFRLYVVFAHNYLKEVVLVWF